jgi:SNF2 family DNA or RNA helicase
MDKTGSDSLVVEISSGESSESDLVVLELPESTTEERELNVGIPRKPEAATPFPGTRTMTQCRAPKNNTVSRSSRNACRSVKSAHVDLPEPDICGCLRGDPACTSAAQRIEYDSPSPMDEVDIDDCPSTGSSIATTTTTDELLREYPGMHGGTLTPERQHTRTSLSSDQIAMELTRLGLRAAPAGSLAIQRCECASESAVPLADAYLERFAALAVDEEESKSWESSPSLELVDQESCDHGRSRRRRGKAFYVGNGMRARRGIQQTSLIANEHRAGTFERRELGASAADRDVLFTPENRPLMDASEMSCAGPRDASDPVPRASMLVASHRALDADPNTWIESKRSASAVRTPVAFTPGLELLEHQRQAVAWMIARERERSPATPAGGILADEPGLGKTLTAISLILLNKADADMREAPASSPATLVVCPLSLLRQWSQEIRKSTVQGLGPSVVVYHGSNRADLRPQLGCADIVLTTYAVLCAESPQLSPEKEQILRSAGPLFQYRWYRVILDEAHSIRNVNSRVSRSACLVEARSRWCLTGTPVQNNVHDVLALLLFLRHPACSSMKAYSRILSSVSGTADNVDHTEAAGSLGRLLCPVLLRRCRDDTVNGRPILELEPRHDTVEYVDFSPAERHLYECMESVGRELLRDLSTNDANPSSFVNTFVLITRLRQICDHYTLLKSYVERLRTAPCTADTSMQEQQARSTVLQGPDAPDRGAVASGSGHVEIDSMCDAPAQVPDASCTEAAACVQDNGHAPRAWHQRDASAPETARRATLLEALIRAWTAIALRDSTHDGGSSSSKLRTLMALLDQGRIQAPTEKWIVFSQWPSFLDICEDVLTARGQAVCRLDGSMRPEERELNLSLFKRPEYPILLMSLGAGGVGLNLTEANHVVLVDPWWNPAVEEQAIHRVYRLGQKRSVQVIRLVVRDTVEERVMQLQHEKRALYQNVLGGDPDVMRQPRLTLFDLHWLLRCL